MLCICVLVWQRTSQEKCLGGDLEVAIQVQFLRVACQYSVSHSGSYTLCLVNYLFCTQSQCIVLKLI
jgi:hypothetical protein